MDLRIKKEKGFVLITIFAVIVIGYLNPRIIPRFLFNLGNQTYTVSPIFAIVLQTEECLPDYLMTKEYIGNQTFCNCDIYVLSFKKPCVLRRGTFKHVSYIYNNTVRWSAGRNLALLEAKKKRRSYLYYVLMDDDVQLAYNRYTPMEFVKQKIPPFKIFTDFLQHYRPAVATTDFQVFNIAQRTLRQWRTGCKRKDIPRVIPIGHMDACFNAFHRDAVDTILPYPEIYDSRCHWISTIHVSYVIQIAFHGQLAWFKEITAANPLHRIDVSQGGRYLFDMDIRRELLTRIREDTPLQFRNHPIFQKMINYPIAGVDHTMCIDPPPPNSPIVPYRVMPNNSQLLAAYKLVNTTVRNSHKYTL